MKNDAHIVCQITRGLAPATAIVNIVNLCHTHAQTYHLVERMDSIAARNEAFELAFIIKKHLILVEDDVIVAPNIFEEALRKKNVCYASAHMSNKQLNIGRNHRGEFLYSGTCFVKVPFHIINMFRRPVFESHDFSIKDGNLVARGKSTSGNAGDVWFWYQLRKQFPDEPIEHLGTVKHILHELQRGRSKPSIFEII